MKFIMEQIALHPASPVEAAELLHAMGLKDWSQDAVVANGSVRGEVGQINKALLAFNYTSRAGAVAPLELEVLHYTEGAHWTKGYGSCISHIGMHCKEEELDEWKKFFAERKIPIAQEVFTQSHTNPAIAGKRLYHYCIFATRSIIGVDVKFIVRRNLP